MSFASLVGISTHLQGNVSFDFFIRTGQGGSGGGVPLGLSRGTLFLGRHTGLAPFQVFHFFLILISRCVW